LGNPVAFSCALLLLVVVAVVWKVRSAAQLRVAVAAYPRNSPVKGGAPGLMTVLNWQCHQEISGAPKAGSEPVTLIREGNVMADLIAIGYPSRDGHADRQVRQGRQAVP
jgi:hypothetical protein